MDVSSATPAGSFTTQEGAISKLSLSEYVGLDKIPKQIEKRLLGMGFVFNLMLVGCSGLGKTTLLNTLFSTRILEPTIKFANTHKTVEINTVTNVIEENGVNLRLTIIDTPGFGDQLNNENCWDPIVKYVKDRYSAYLRKELMPTRERFMQDNRVHAILYFIRPSGHSLSLLDLTFMKKLSVISNLIPLIAKSDTLTIQERIDFKRRIRAEMDFHKIAYYPYSELVDANSETNDDERDTLLKVRELIPFAVVGSERNVLASGDKVVRGRRTKWGTINIDNPEHCEFGLLRDFLIRSQIDQLVQSTTMHYENYRKRQLMALRENSRINSKSSNANTKDGAAPVYSQGKSQSQSYSQSQSHSQHQPPTPSPAS